MDEGGWESHASEVDGILNTMAALLALKLHADTPQYPECLLPDDIGTIMFRASVALQNMLNEWDIEAYIHVGFEILFIFPAQTAPRARTLFHHSRRGRFSGTQPQKARQFRPSNALPKDVHHNDSLFGGFPR